MKHVTRYRRWRYERMRNKMRAKYKDKYHFPDKMTEKELSKFDTLGIKWWLSRPVSTMEGQPVGLDITGLPITMDDIRQAMKNNIPEGSNHWKSLRAEYRYKKNADGTGQLEHVGDVGVKVEFYRTGYTHPTSGNQVVLTIRNGVPDIPNWLDEDAVQEVLRRFEQREA